MKKIFLVILLLILCPLLTVVSAYASNVDAHDDAFGDYNADNVFDNVQNDISNMIDNSTDNNHIGVVMSGYYFAVQETQKLPFIVRLYNKALVADDLLAQQLNDKIYDIVNYIDSIANTQYESSDIYRYNALSYGGSIDISDATAEMIILAKEVYSATDGAYNPSAYRLVDLWGFSSRKYYDDRVDYSYDRVWQQGANSWYYPLPQTQYIDAFKQLADFDAVSLTGDKGSYQLTKNCQDVVVEGKSYSQWIDLGGVAKGFAVDKVKQLLEIHQQHHYYIDSASSSMMFSTKENGDSFQLGLRDPKDMFRNYAVLPVSNSGVSTSGLYERFYKIGDKRYSHIINAKTGYPIDSGVETVTITGGNAATNDCMTTAMVVMGQQSIINYMNSADCQQQQYKIIALNANPRTSSQYHMIANISKDYLLAYDASYPLITDIKYNADGSTTVILGSIDNNDSAILYVVLSIVAAVILGIIIYRRFHYPKSTLDNVDSIRKGKLFRWSDVIVYSGLAVVIVVLLVVFVFGNTAEPLANIEIVSATSNQTLYSYNAVSKSGSIAASLPSFVKVSQTTDEDNNIVITVTQGERYNIITIYSDNTVKVTQAVCGLHKECVYNFPPIVNKGDVIVCSPNNIRVVGY